MACLKIFFGRTAGSILERVESATVTSEEDRALRESCGLLDRSERGKLLLIGPQAAEFLQGQVTNDIEALAAGAGCYAAFLTNKGKMLGDARVLAVERGLWLDTERSALQEVFNLIRRFRVGFEVEMHKRTLERALFSLVGPDARRVAGAEDLPEEEHSHRLVSVNGIAARAVVTNLGVDLIADADQGEALRTGLEEAGATPVSEPAVETLRVERGRPRYGIDLDESVIPQEAGLNDRAVSFTKGCYVGQETVARLFYRGKPNRLLRGLRLSSAASAGDELLLGERRVGALGSVALSPAHGPIALALVRREAEPGSTVAVGESQAPAEVVELPF
jgi:folate-binding protein YgfZ